MLAMARCGDHAGAARIAEALVEGPNKDGATYVQAACGFSLASDAVRKAIGGNTDLVKHYIDRALECLRAAKDRGYEDVQGLETDTDLEPIRKEPAFRTLLGEFPQRVGKLP